MKRFGVLMICTLFLCRGLSVSAAAIRDQAGTRNRPGELTLLHTNDHHGVIFSVNGRGGLDQIGDYIRAVRAESPQVLLLDAGDINANSALSTMLSPELDVLAYNLLEYDAIVFGSHEFDGSMRKLEQQIDAAAFPFVCSNIKTPDGGFLGGNRYIVKRYDTFSVGIFGITTLLTLSASNPDKNLVFIDEIEAAAETVEILKKKENVDIVIALTHIGDKKESPNHITSPELAAAVSGINVIVDGYSHTYMEAPIRVGSTWIVSAHEGGKYIGHGKLVVSKGRLVNFIWKPIAIGQGG